MSSLTTSSSSSRMSYRISSEPIDDILKHLAELENRWQSSLTLKNLIQTLNFELRYGRIHLRYLTCLSPEVVQTRWAEEILDKINIFVEDVKNWLIEPRARWRIEERARCLMELTANKRMAWEGTLLSLLQNNHLRKKTLDMPCYDYYVEEIYGQGLDNYQDVLVDGLMVEWLDPLLENLKHLSRCIDLNLLVFPKQQIKDLEEKLKSLRNFLHLSGMKLEMMNNREPEYSPRGKKRKKRTRKGQLYKTSEDLLSHIKFVIQDAIYLCYKLWTQHNRSDTDRLFFDLFIKIKHIEAEIRMIYVQFLKTSDNANPGILGIDLQVLAYVDSLLDNVEELLKHQGDASIIPLDAHQLAFLNQELSLLRYFLMDPHLKPYTEPEPGNFPSLLIEVGTMVRKGLSLLQSISDGRKKDNMTEELNVNLSSCLEVVNLLKPRIRQMYLRVPRPSTSNFPRTPKLCFLNFFIQDLEELLRHRIDSIAYVKNEIETVHSELALLSCSIGDTINNPEEDENIGRSIMDAAHEAECVIDLISASYFPRWDYMLWLFDVTEKIKLLRKESTEVCSKKQCYTSVLNMEEACLHYQPPTYTLLPEEEMVGFKDEAEEIIHQLTGYPKELNIVSIIGMPGLGKTTLAKKVYEDPSITRYFHVRSWYCISQVHDRRDLLLSILGDVTELTMQKYQMNDEDIEEALCKNLRGRKYLIVLDDIWCIESWYDIHRAFPDDCNGSRILFTSRIRDVALQANPRTRTPLDLRMFTDEESWELLQKKVFQRRNYSPELYAIGKQVAKNCKGLPLSVALIAGILLTVESKDDWRKISKSLSKEIVRDSRKRSVLELSYKNLPDHLKPCFLYLGAFPEDKEIPAWKLIRLWMAEGFVQKTESESLEKVAEGYLNDLIGRSLVLVAKNKCSGGVKSCRLHDLLHEFSREKAKNEKFLLLSKELVNLEQYRHCFYCDNNIFYGWMPDDSYVRSLLCFATGRSYYHDLQHDFNPPDLSVLPYILKLLRVLDLEHIYLGHNLPTEIGLLVHLRYLAIRGAVNHVPSSMGNLWRLETFRVNGTKGEVQLPETLFMLEHLKHVHVNTRTAFQFENFFTSRIQKLSTPAFRHGDDTTKMVIRNLPNLRKLKCIFLRSCERWEDWKNWKFKWYNWLPVLDSLSELESLHATYYGLVDLPYVFSFPSTLKKLTLSSFHFPWSEISKIGRLPRLEVLKLLFGAFDGRRWDVSDDEFQNLKVLKLESLNIVEWDASHDAFPCLEQLVLQRCKQLIEIPSSFRELATLSTIEVQWCSYSATKSMWRIKEELQELGNDELKVVIQPSTSAPAF